MFVIQISTQIPQRRLRSVHEGFVASACVDRVNKKIPRMTSTLYKFFITMNLNVKRTHRFLLNVFVVFLLGLRLCV